MTLQMRPDCENCGRDLPPDSNEALICSFECTFCAACVAGPLGGACPNCGGDLRKRPSRAGHWLANHPASTVRKGPS
jgi:hypothetical protein